MTRRFLYDYISLQLIYYNIRPTALDACTIFSSIVVLLIVVFYQIVRVAMRIVAMHAWMHCNLPRYVALSLLTIPAALVVSIVRIYIPVMATVRQPVHIRRR